MPRLYEIAILASLMSPLTWPMTSGAHAGELTTDRKAELSYLVLQDCGSCHGMTMKGGLGSPLTPDALGEADTLALAAIILDGIPDRPMPPWRGLISPEEAVWIADALKKGAIR